MRNRYIDLIRQTYDFPQKGFEVQENYLSFYDIDLMELIKEHGTPLKITYLPRIGNSIRQARNWFNEAIEEHGYHGKYHYCYCTKSSHFSFIMDEVIKAGSHLETSSSFDIDIIRNLQEKGKITKNIRLVCNGYKPEEYIEKIKNLIHDGFKNVIPVMDNMEELNHYLDIGSDEIGFGLRIATEEEPLNQFYTSRLGIRYEDIIPFYIEKIKPNAQFHLRMLHFFIDSGIKDTAYYWSELMKCLNIYAELKKLSPGLEALNIGGGLPIRNSLGHKDDHGYVISEIIRKTKAFCDDAGVDHPDIYTEFGSFTVGESGAVLFKVLGEKKQNESERWYMIDGSLMTTLPDVWGMNSRFILLPVNNWDHEYHRTNIGGLSCDVGDYYNSEVHINQVYMPKLSSSEDQYVGFFHTGAYQDALSGYGGVNHCLIPAPKHIVIDKNEAGKLTYEIFNQRLGPGKMLDALGYT
ncbi:MAG: arginine decarboxylase [Bacteroidetes bacterium]|nr:arginine decarboxylase [Bacteroidota bacterium]